MVNSYLNHLSKDIDSYYYPKTTKTAKKHFSLAFSYKFKDLTEH